MRKNFCTTHKRAYIRVVKHKIRQKMILPKELIEKWQVLKSPGDAAKMAERAPEYSDETFNRAFRDGKCNDDVFKVIADFYEEKANLIKQYL